VGRNPGAVEPGVNGAGAEHAGDDVPGQWLEADGAGPDPGEQGPGRLAPHGSPGVERRDGIGEGVLAVGDGHLLAVSLLVHLRLPDVEQEAGGLVFDVGEGEGDDLGAAQGGGVAEQDDRGIADADGRRAVDAGDDLADLINSERSGQSARRGAVGAHQPAAHLPDGLGGDGVLDAGDAVDVSDGGARDVEGARRLPASARSVR